MSYLDTEKLDHIIEEEMKGMRIPGLAIAVVSGSDTVYLKGFGRADDSGKAVTEDTLFFIGSSSKSFTAMAIMQLAEEGKLKIDDPVIKYLPAMKEVRNSGEMTVRHLLNHTSGFSTYEGMKVFQRNAEETLSQLAENLKNFRLSRKPGVSFAYSNLNYVLLGAILERVSGMTYDVCLEEKIFKPLGMNSSFANGRKAKASGLEKGYQTVLGSIRQTEHEFHQSIVPAGYIASCAKDMAKYLAANLNGGLYKNARVLSEEGIRMLHTKSSPVSRNYGLGWFDCGELVHHGGNVENYHANMMLLPAEKIGFAILYNINDNISGAFVKGSYDKGETVVYDRIQSRILNELAGKEIVSPVIGRGKGIHEKINIVLGSMFVLLTLYGTFILRSRRADFPLLFMMDFLLPGVLLITLPHLFKAAWGAMFRFARGFAHALCGLSVYLILIGILKLILIFFLPVST